jgi:hypothetical protein
VAGRDQGGWGRREVEGRPDRWDLVVKDWERGRERWAGGASWAGKGDGPAACCECGLKKNEEEEWKGAGPREKGKGERV